MHAAPRLTRPEFLHCTAALCACALLAACQNPSTTLTHAGKDPLPDLAPTSHPDDGDAAGTTAGAVDLAGNPVKELPPPSIASLDRSDWDATTIHQPRGQVEVQPWYYSRFEGFGQDARVTGAYPTTATALGVRGGVPTAVQEGLAQPFIGFFWLAAVPVQVVAEPPLTTVRTPDRQVEWLPAPAPTAQSGAVLPAPTPPPAAPTIP